MNPFRELIKPKDPFYWDEAQKYCNCNGHTPACCKTGWKLTFAGSRLTTKAESKYSPTEGEALTVAWSLHRSKFFTLGCKNLIIATDHQPLLGLFRKQLYEIPNPRLLPIREKTLMFNFSVVYTPCAFNIGADAISCNPVSEDVSLIEMTNVDEELRCKSLLILASFDDANTCNASDMQYYAKLLTKMNPTKSYKILSVPESALYVAGTFRKSPFFPSKFQAYS